MPMVDPEAPTKVHSSNEHFGSQSPSNWFTISCYSGFISNVALALFVVLFSVSTSAIVLTFGRLLQHQTQHGFRYRFFVAASRTRFSLRVWFLLINQDVAHIFRFRFYFRHNLFFSFIDRFHPHFSLRHLFCKFAIICEFHPVLVLITHPPRYILSCC